MDNQIFDNYQKRILKSMSTPNPESDDFFTILSKILDNLKKYINEKQFSLSGFRSEIEKQFKITDTSDQTAKQIKKTLLQCNTKAEAIITITDLYNMVKPISLQIGSWTTIASITEEFMSEIEKSILNSN